MEVMKLNAAIKLLDEVSPTVDQINDALGDMEKALGVTREAVDKNRKAMEEMAKAGQMTEFALEKLGITTEEYFQVLQQQEQAAMEAAAAMDKLHEEASNIDKTMPKAGDGALALSRALEGIGSAATRVGMVMTGLTAGLALFVNQSRTLAINAVESENLFEVSMGGMAEETRNWSEEMSKTLGVNQWNIRKMAGTFNVMTTSMGLTGDQAFDLSKKMTTLSYDMASFYNISVEEASRKIQGGLTGEAESLKRLGIVINETSVQQAAFRNGINKSVESMTNAEKVQARMLAIWDATSKAQGDMERTMDSPANAIRRFGEKMEELKIKFGTALLPVFQDFTSFLNNEMVPMIEKLVNWFTNASTGTKVFIGTIAGIAMAAGPALLALGQMAQTLGGLAQGYSGFKQAQAAGAFDSITKNFTAMKEGALGATAAIKSLVTVQGWKDLLSNVTALGSQLKALGSMNLSSLGALGGTAAVAGAAAFGVAVAAATDSLADNYEATKRNEDGSLKYARAMMEAATSTDESKRAVYEHLSAQEKLDVQMKVTRANLEEATANVGLFAGGWSLVTEAWDSLEIGSFTDKWGILGTVIDGVMLPVTALKKLMEGLSWAFAEARKGVEMAAEALGLFVDKADLAAQAAQRSANAKIMMANASRMAGKEFKDEKEATEWLRQNTEKMVQAQKEAAKITVESAEQMLAAEQKRLLAAMKQNKEEERIKIAKKLINREKDKDMKMTIEEAENIIKTAVANGFYKEKVDQAAAAVSKKTEAVRKHNVEMDKLLVNLQSQITAEEEAMAARASKDQGPMAQAQTAAAKVLSDAESKIAKLKAEMDKTISDAAAKKMAVPPEVIATYEKLFGVIRANAKEGAAKIIDEAQLAMLERFGPVADTVAKKFRDLQAAMSARIEFDGGISNLSTEALTTYTSEMLKLAETGKLTAEQYAAMGPIFEEAFKRGIISSDQLAISTGKTSAELLKLQSMFGPTADQIADKFRDIQKGIAAGGGISNMLKVNPNAGKAAIEALQGIKQSGLATSDMLKTMSGQFGLAEAAGVKSASKIAHEQMVAQKSTQKWGQILQGLIGVFGMFGGAAAEALAGVAQLAGNAMAEFKGVGELQKKFAENMKDPKFATDELAVSDAKAEISQSKFNATINAGAAAAGLLGGMLSKSSNATMQQAGAALQGAAAGAKMGAAFGPIGAGIGAAIGGITSWISAGKKMKAEVTKMYDEFVKAAGGIDKLSAKAKDAGISLEAVMKNKGTKNVEAMKKAIAEATEKLAAFDDLLQTVGAKDMAGLKVAAAEAGVSLKALFDAKTVDEYKNAAKQVKEEMESWGEAQDALQGAMDKYGITVDQLGGKFKQAGFDKMGLALLKDFEILKAAGVDVSVITEKMSTDMSDYVNRATAAGSTIPMAMKPVIEQMIAQGKLLDENGKAYGSLEEAGITFAQTLEEGISSAVDAINKLVAVLAKGFNVPVDVYDPNAGNNPSSGGGGGGGGNPNQDDGIPYAGGSGGFRDFGKGTKAVLHGIEAVVRPQDIPEMTKGGGGGDTNVQVNLAISENPMQTAETVEQMRKFTVEAVEREVAKNLADMIASGRA